MVHEGMLVSSIKRTSKDAVIVSRELKKFDVKEINSYNKMFLEYKKEGVIEAESFEANNWKVVNLEDGLCRKRNLNFKFEINNNINNIIKCYVINLLNNKLGINEVAERLKYNSETLHFTNYFNDDKYEDYEEFILEKSDSEILKYKDRNSELISFLDYKILDMYSDFLDSINIKVEKNTRTLPDYKSILYFDYIVDKLLSNEYSQDIYKFFPVLLWWKITSVIPIRPIEFLRLKKGCFFEKNGKYYLQIKRKKPNSFVQRALGEVKIQEFRVNEELYNLAQSYTKKIEHQSDYFICRNFYNNFEENEKRRITEGNKAFPHYYFDTLLKRFYTEFIENIFGMKNIGKKEIKKNYERFINSKMGNKIVRLQLGDSRHLAIINLILQGTNSYLIKEMAGHRDINSHLHYSKHAKEFISSKVIVLTDILNFELQVNEQMENRKFSVGNKRYENSIINNNQNMMKLDNYFCKKYIGREELFPYLCQSQCNECNYSILDINSVSSNELNSQIIECKSEMEKNLEILIKYINEVDIRSVLDNKKEKYFSVSQQNIKESANKIDYLIMKEANLESYKFQKNIINLDD